MIFWDSSSVIPLLIREKSSPVATDLLNSDPDMAVWWAIRIECASALARLEREEILTMAAIEEALERLEVVENGSVIVEPVQSVKSEAERLLRRHNLRAANAMQLAAACIFRMEFGPLDFASEDQRLISAAFREGFLVRRISNS